jgi:septal ring factor EnvC (AmiA/AmiB activator)
MPRTLAWIASLALVGALFWAAREHHRAEALARSLAQAEAQSQQAQTATQACADRSRGSLGQAFATAMAARRQAPKVDAPAPPAGDAPKPKGFEDLSGDDQSKLFDDLDKQKKNAQQRLAELAQKLGLSGEQTHAMQKNVDQMNERIGRALTALIPVFSQGENMQTRPAIDAVAEGLNAIRESEDAFRASLNERQQAELATNPLDFAKQVDTSLLVTSALAMAANSNSGNGAVSVHVGP